MLHHNNVDPISIQRVRIKTCSVPQLHHLFNEQRGAGRVSKDNGEVNVSRDREVITARLKSAEPVSIVIVGPRTCFDHTYRVSRE